MLDASTSAGFDFAGASVVAGGGPVDGAVPGESSGGVSSGSGMTTGASFVFTGGGDFTGEGLVDSKPEASAGTECLPGVLPSLSPFRQERMVSLYSVSVRGFPAGFRKTGSAAFTPATHAQAAIRVNRIRQDLERKNCRDCFVNDGYLTA
jgi:hypothetical protein